MPTYTSYDTVGVKQDVSETISNLSPTKTPFQSAIGTEKATQKKFEWQEDTLRDVQDNAKPEGFVAEDVTIVPTLMRDNVMQILSETIKIAGTTDATKHFGRAKESAYQLAKTSAQLKRDLENAYVGTAQTKVAPTDNLTIRKMAGFQRSVLKNGSDAAASSVNNVVYTGTTAFSEGVTNPNLDEELHLLPLLQQLYQNGAEPKLIHVTPSNSRVLAKFAKASGRYRTIESKASRQDQKTIVNAVDLYVSPFGEQRVMINRFQRAKNTLVFEADMWKKVWLRSWFRETLAKTGDALSMMIVGEVSLKHKNFAASGVIVDNTVAGTGF